MFGFYIRVDERTGEISLWKKTEKSNGHLVVIKNIITDDTTEIPSWFLDKEFSDRDNNYIKYRPVDSKEDLLEFKEHIETQIRLLTDRIDRFKNILIKFDGKK